MYISMHCGCEERVVFPMTSVLSMSPKTYFLYFWRDSLDIFLLPFYANANQRLDIDSSRKRETVALKKYVRNILRRGIFLWLFPLMHRDFWHASVAFPPRLLLLLRARKIPHPPGSHVRIPPRPSPPPPPRIMPVSQKSILFCQYNAREEERRLVKFWAQLSLSLLYSMFRGARARLFWGGSKKESQASIHPCAYCVYRAADMAEV